MSWLQRIKRAFSGKRESSDENESESHAERSSFSYALVETCGQIPPAPERNLDPERRRAERFMSEGYQLREQGDLVGALKAFHKAAVLHPHADAFYARGVANCIFGRQQDAIADLTKALDLQPRFPAALTERGLAYVQSGEVDKGLLDYDAALDLDPSYATAYSNKGTALCLQSRWAEAIPYLTMALRIDPAHAENGEPLYNRSAAHEMIGNAQAAVKDLEAYLASYPVGALADHARSRLAELRPKAGSETAPEQPLLRHVWTEVVSVAPGWTISELIVEIRARGAFFAVMEWSPTRLAVQPVYGRRGLRRRLTDIADQIGEEILPLRLEQIHDLWKECVPVELTADPELIVRRLRESGGYTLVQEGDRSLGVLSGGFTYEYPRLPTDIFGPRMVFERHTRSEASRECPACGATVAYFEPVLRDGMLEDYACPHCKASPIPSWIEGRMRPGSWSRAGFLGEQENLTDVIAADDLILERLGLSHGQIADALDHLLDAASNVYADRIAEAATRFTDGMLAAGQTGVEGEAILPIEPSLDEVEERLRHRKFLPEQGVSIGRFQVFLQVYLGYQYCPWTVLSRPWSEDTPPLPITVRRKGNALHQTAVTGCRFPCRSGVIQGHGDRDFLIVRRDTGEHVRGSGLIAHLIREHHFFEGPEARYRLDPERAARVLGLLDTEE